MLTVERLRELLDYDQATGVFRWKINKGRVSAGDVAGSVHPDYGYLYIKIDNKAYRAHRLAWFYVTGSWPEGEVDHRDTDRLNNRFSNLREATSLQNKHNSAGHKDSVSGLKGVTFKKDVTNGKPWWARIQIEGKTRGLGFFSTPEEAHAAYSAAAKDYFGEFARV